ncbi:NPCBM/NEW2 domain-containing protein [Dactylosporangium vinaceum]|uniref:NPCBM/NEW2 domain-containing protein n=1 Tax=Dactylosporangium vinaceum TaxID=53362 RepID=A0ABV5M8U4_9ACTN|nr:hypothetical protein [Dactylosporangium vinaceum]UAB99571.1 NPCBM/NEW2 domain-containing protein [Dactylosporangium vinaceum]
MRLWNWFKEHPGLAAIGVAVSILGLLVSILALVRDATDFKITAGPAEPPTVSTSPAGSPHPTFGIGSPTSVAPSRFESQNSPSAAPSQSSVKSEPPLEQSPAPSPVYLIARTSTAENTAGAGSFSMSGKLYEQSVKKWCGTAQYASKQTWTSGGFTRFAATVGIADDESGATGYSVSVTFENQDGQALNASFVVSLGHPKSVDFPLNGAVRLVVRCVIRSGGTSTHVTLGDARLL